MSLELKIGVEARDYAEVAKKEHLQPLEARSIFEGVSVVCAFAVPVLPMARPGRGGGSRVCGRRRTCGAWRTPSTRFIRRAIPCGGAMAVSSERARA